MRRSRLAGILCAGLYAGTLWGQSAWPSYPNNSAISIESNGNVGIGTSNPSDKLDIVGVSALGFFLGDGTRSWIGTRDTSMLQLAAGSGTPGSGGYGGIVVANGTGNVGIGTTSPAHLLHVAGQIGAEEVIVSSTGADYVFNPDYNLAPLTEVAGYIKEHHHLPDIPSAPEVQEKGVSLGEMQAKLLAKIEELTLHMIQAEERNRKLQERITRLEEAGGGAKSTQ